VKRVAEKRKGACADGTYAILNTQLGYLDAYGVRPGVRLTDLRLEALDGDGDLILALLKWQANLCCTEDSIILLRNVLKEVLDRAMSQVYHLQHPLHDPEVQRDLRGLFKALREAEPERVKAMTSEQAQHFLKVAEEHSRMFPLFALGFGTGPRLGELLSLHHDDDAVRFVQGEPTRQLHVGKALTQRMSRLNPHPKRLKNGADYHADVPMDVGMILDEHKRTRHHHTPWLFQTSTGTPYSHEAVQGEFKRIAKLAWPKDPGADEQSPNPVEWDFSPHSMRHTFATLHILAGRDAKWVSEQLGHADITITLKVYASAFRMVRPGTADAHGAWLFSYRTQTPGADGNGMVQSTPMLPAEPAPVLH